MLAIEMLPAGHGDALVVEYGTGRDVHRLLVDAGTIHSWEQVRARLLKLPNRTFEAFVVTHVDEDHIGGAVKLLADPDLKHRVDDVWFNGFVHCTRGGSVLGPKDGERLTRLIGTGGYRWNRPFSRKVSPAVGGPAVVASRGALPSFALDGGAVLHLLSPSGPKLKKMATEWERVVVEAGLVPGEGLDIEARKPPRHHKEVDPLPAALTDDALDAMAAGGARDPSEANGSSIAFLLEFDGKRILLGADAHADVLVASLRRFGEAVGEARVRVDACKLPHHASKNNVSAELIQAIDCGNYLVSTNGDNHAHPDDTAIARVLRNAGRKVTFSCNFRSDRTEPWQARQREVGATFKLPAAGKAGLRVKLA
jgi:beta-lactamase superfamily II metal-dependent hydrolase